MKWIDRLAFALGPRPRNSTASNPSQWFVDWVRGTQSDSGIDINGQTALTYSTIYQAVTVLSGDPGQLPFEVYRRTGDDNKDKEIDKNHPAYKLVRHRPNKWMSDQTFKETMQLYALLWGNGVAEIQRNNGSQPISLTPLLPDRTWLEVVDGVPWYLTRTKMSEEPRKLRPQNVLHIIGLSYDGMWGINVIEKARNSWGLGQAAEKYSNKLFGNSAMPSGVLEFPQGVKRFDDTAIERIRKKWADVHEGLDNAARIAILQEGAKFNPISFSNRDAQWLEGRQFQRTEIASWFNLPPHKVGDLERATFSNIEEQNLEYLQTSLMRWLVKWQTECREKLLTREEKRRDSHFFEFNTRALLRGSVKSRFEAYSIGISNRFLSPNEARRAESLPGYEGGDEFSNPNIEPQSEPEEPEEEQPEGMQDRERTSLRLQLNNLVSVEINTIKRKARDPKGFTGWMDHYYSEARWPARMRNVLDIWQRGDLADVWCDQSLELLQDLVSTTTARTMAEDVDVLLCTWPDRVEALVNQIDFDLHGNGGQPGGA